MASSKRGDAGSRASSGTWEERRAPAVASLLEAPGGEFCDLWLVAGRPPERVPAARLLLAAASPALSRQLRPGALPRDQQELAVPRLSAAAARAIVAYSCGLPRPFDACHPEDAQAAVAVLKRGLGEAGPAAPRAANGHECGAEGERRALGRPLGTPRWRLLAPVGWTCLVIASLAAYLPTLSFNMQVGGAFMDDVMIIKNPFVVGDVLDIPRLLRTDYWGLEMFDPQTWTHKSFRPLAVLTFRWNYLLHGFDSNGFYVTNAVFHAIASFQLGLFGRRCLGLSGAWSALLAALFAAHPVHSESICYVVGRADILCLQVLLLSAEVYAPCVSAKQMRQAEGLVRLVVACALFVVAGLCKETGFTFFGLPIVWEVLRLTRPAGAGRGGAGAAAWPAGSAAAALVRLVVLLAVGAAACCARVWYTSGTQIARMDPYSNPVAASEDPWIRRLSYSLVHGMYVRLLLWPTFLCYDYSMDAVPLVHSLADVRLLLPCASYLGLAALGTAAVRCLRPLRGLGTRVIAEGPAVGIVVFLLGFLPMSNIFFPIGTLVAERLLYIPSAGALAALVSIAHVEASSGPVRRRGHRIAAVGLVATLGFWWVLCYRRVLEWQSVQSITLADGLKQPRSSRTQFNLGNLMLQASRLDEALAAYMRANGADPQERDAMPLYHAGQILMYQGRYPEAEQFLHKAVTGYFSPLTLAEEEVWHDYGLALWHVGRREEAVQNFQNAITTNPAFPKGYNNLGCALVLLGLSATPANAQTVQQGLQAMEQAISLLPSTPLYWRNAAVLLHLGGDGQPALRAWEQYRQLDPAGAAAAEAAGGLPQDCIWEFYFR